MITTVIKRNHEKEPFYPNKLNRWAEWASARLGDKVDWSSIVTEAYSNMPAIVTSVELQETLIDTCVKRNTSSYNKMGGRLYAALLLKEIHDGTYPSIKELHTSLVGLGVMVQLGFTDDEYEVLNTVIDHSRNLDSTHTELAQFSGKYVLQNKITGELYETPQFAYMRMAMALGGARPKESRMADTIGWYTEFSSKRLSAPTPNYVNLGTAAKGYFSCCLYATADTAKSIGVGEHIGYSMTVNSAGMGSYLGIRSVGDPVHNGAIVHQGKLPYYTSMAGSIRANMQNGRGGACTTFFTCFDPEVLTLLNLKNPKSPEDKRNRQLDYCMMYNQLFMEYAAKSKEVFTFNTHTAPDLTEALFAGDPAAFKSLYNKYEADPMFVKNYIDARETMILALNQTFETGAVYLMAVDIVNSNTPFKDPIYSSNLCLEIVQPTASYECIQDLYLAEDHGRGEISLCSLAAINVSEFDSATDLAGYETTMRLALLMCDVIIDMSEYAFPHLEVTAKARRNTAIGITGLAHKLAKVNLKYSSDAGKEMIHDIAERHMYAAVEQSLELSKELGVCEWSHKTKWADGWLPIDNASVHIGGITPNLSYKQPWENLRARVVENGGIRNSSLVAHMPTESSSKATGTSQSVYPVRDHYLVKSDNGNTIRWCAPDIDTLGDNYELAYDISNLDMIQAYGIIQKFTDQSISSENYRTIVGDDKVGSKEMLDTVYMLYKYGMKTRYYQVTRNTKGGFMSETNTTSKCSPGGSCSL